MNIARDASGRKYSGKACGGRNATGPHLPGRCPAAESRVSLSEVELSWSTAQAALKAAASSSMGTGDGTGVEADGGATWGAQDPAGGNTRAPERGRSARGLSRSCRHRRRRRCRHCRALPRTRTRLEAPRVATATGEAGRARAAGARPAAAGWGRWGLMHPDQGAVTPHLDRSPVAPASPAASGCRETRGQRDCELLPPVSHSYPTGGPVAAAPPGFLEGPSVPSLDLRLAYSGDPWQFPLQLSLLDHISVTRPRECIPSNPSWGRNRGAPCAPALDPHGVCGG